MTKREFLSLLRHATKLGVRWRVGLDKEGYSIIMTAAGKEPLAVVHELVFGEPTSNSPFKKIGEGLGLQKDTTLRLAIATHNPAHWWRIDLLRATGFAV